MACKEELVLTFISPVARINDDSRWRQWQMNFSVEIGNEISTFQQRDLIVHGNALKDIPEICGKLFDEKVDTFSTTNSFLVKHF